MQIVDIRLILWPFEGESVRHPGKQPLKYVLYIDGKRYYETTGYYLFPDQFNEQAQEIVKHPSAKFYNAILQKKLKRYQDEILKKVALEEEVTKEILDRNNKRGGFFDFCKVVRPDDVTPTMTNRMYSFLLREPQFKEINIDFCRKYEQWHIDEEYSQNTLHQSMKYLRRICTQAQAENYIRKNPFKPEGGGYKMPEYIQPETVFLNEPERNRFFDLFLKYKAQYEKVEAPVYTKQYKTLVYFMLACYTGFRHSDWGKFDVETRVQEDNMIRLRAHKNKQWVVFVIGKKLALIIEEIRKIGLFTINNGDTNDYLRELVKEAEVNKDITSHAGRHSFGYLCACLDFSEADTAHFLGVSLDTVKVYYHITGEVRKGRTKKLAEV